MKPLADALAKRGDKYLWYVAPTLFQGFPYKHMTHTNSLKSLEEYNADAIFASGEDIPFWLRGLKVQIFDTLAGEKPNYFRNRDYFDLYLTQGPYFTERFKKLAQEHKNFEVIETGWSKLDNLHTIAEDTMAKKEKLLLKYKAEHIVLYAPSLLPSLTSAIKLKEVVHTLSARDEILFLVKFHDDMERSIVEEYKAMSEDCNLLIIEDSDIIPSMHMADLLLSDTTSVVYEFTFLDKPVITLDSQSENIAWSNHTEVDEIFLKVLRTLEGSDVYTQKRKETTVKYHPYTDGESSKRVLEVTEAYIKEQGVPENRKLPFFKKWKLKRKYKKQII